MAAKKKAAKKPAVKKAAAKKAPAKKAAAKKPAAKKKAAPKKPAAISPVKGKLTKSALVGILAEQNGLTKAQAAGVLASLEGVFLGSVHPKGNGEFMLPGIMKISLRKIPARKAGTLIRNPATGEMMKAAAKPASVRVKIRPLAKLKKAATS